MDKPYGSLEQHFDLPKIRTVGHDRPLQWLRAGWRDLRENLGASLAYGILLSAIGYAILAYAADRPYLFIAAISGFMLIGPLAAAGLYELSRRSEEGERIGFLGSLRGLARNADSLAFFGAFLAIALLAWERLSAILFALFYRGDVDNVTNFVAGVLAANDNLYFVFAYLMVGAVLALLATAGLGFVRWIEPADWDVARLVPAGPVRDRLAACDPVTQWRFLELIRQPAGLELVAG